MGIKRFVCLANSFKDSNRCVAGIELDSENNPLFENSRPIWLRPVSNIGHGAVPTTIVEHINILDIVEFTMGEYISKESYQCENVSYIEPVFNVIGRFDTNELNILCDSRFQIFGNAGKAIKEDRIGTLKHSLILIKPSEFRVYDKTYEDKYYPKQRLIFKYCGYEYDLPITDPVFLHNYQTNPTMMNDINKIYITLSVGVLNNEWYNKLVAGIIII